MARKRRLLGRGICWAPRPGCLDGVLLANVCPGGAWTTQDPGPRPDRGLDPVLEQTRGGRECCGDGGGGTDGGEDDGGDAAAADSNADVLHSDGLRELQQLQQLWRSRDSGGSSLMSQGRPRLR